MWFLRLGKPRQSKDQKLFLAAVYNHKCKGDSPPDRLVLAGPTGKILLLPEDKNAVIIMVATGTGIAPYRAFWRRFFLEEIEGYKFTGLAWLFMGVANSDAKLYDDELQAILKAYPDQVTHLPDIYKIACHEVSFRGPWSPYCSDSDTRLWVDASLETMSCLVMEAC